MGCGSFPAVDEVEVPCRATGLTSALPAEHREISGCLPGVLPPVSAPGNPSGDGWKQSALQSAPLPARRIEDCGCPAQSGVMPISRAGSEPVAQRVAQRSDSSCVQKGNAHVWDCWLYWTA